MSKEIGIDLDNHLSKCRVCLKDFEIDDTQIKITRIVEIRFEELTNFMLKNSDAYSNVICETCNNNLRSFSAFKKEVIEKQNALSLHVDEHEPHYEEVQCDNYSENIELEPRDFKVEVEDPNYPQMQTYETYDQDEEYLIIPEETTESVEYEEEIVEERLDEDFAQQYLQQLDKNRSKVMRTPKKVYKRANCGICGNSYYKDQLQRHIDKVHYKVKRFFCDLCDFGAFLKCNLSTHMIKHIAMENREIIQCNLCSMTFTRFESLKNHLKTEHGHNSEVLKCFCGKEFNLRHKLTTHIKRTHNNVRNHPCDTCPKRFFTPKELKVHILKSHTPGYQDTEEHFCENCGKKFKSNKSLKNHMKHHSEPEFKCSFEGCTKGFITKLLLTNHEKIHTGQRDHMCHFCEKSFFSANHLRRHIAVSHDKIRINCFVEGCKYSVGRKDYLRNHIISHRDLPTDIKNEYLQRVREMKIVPS